MEEFHGRQKAFLGALLGGVGAVAGSIIPGVGTALGGAIGSAVGGIADSAINANKQRKAANSQARAQQYQVNIKEAESLNNALANTEYQKDFRDRFTFGLGGRVRTDNMNNTPKPAVIFKDRTPKLQVGGYVR